MLRGITELQSKAVNSIINKLTLKKELTFRAPTGSGKTFMMADLMNRILSDNNDVIFFVSTLSKGNLAKQNYEKFIHFSQMGQFKMLKPYLINTQISEEEGLFIPEGYNVYVLARDLYKKNSLLMRGPMINFLNEVSNKCFMGRGDNKRIYLIKDECHQKTNNLDTLNEKFFEKVINFSATPNLRRGQNPDVQITDEEAVNAKLIKRVEFGNDKDTVEDAINKFEEIKVQYRNLLGLNPCLIIQISNKDKADEELETKIFPVLDKEEHQDLKWMVIVDEEKKKRKNKSNTEKRRTNDIVGKGLPKERWKDYAKSNSSTIDIIIFKMVISEGWDIPRACMLYQIRDTQSKQLDEQVMGRVRRNPRLMDYESLVSEEAKILSTTAWVWGIPPQSHKKIHRVSISSQEIRDELQIKTTRIRSLSKKINIDVKSLLKNKSK